MVLEAFHVELSEHQQILVESGVNDVEVEDRFDDVVFCILFAIQLQHEHSTANVDQDDGNDQSDVPDVFYCSLDQSHIEGCTIE